MTIIAIRRRPLPETKNQDGKKILPSMIGTLPKKLFDRLTLLVVGVLIVGILAAQVQAQAAPAMDPEADKILRSMSDFMGHLAAFSVKADIDNEIIDREGQKLQFSSSAEIVLKRPSHLFLSRKGAIADMDLIFDGKVLTIYGRNLNVYYQKDSPGSTDAVIEDLHSVIGVDTPGADLLYSDVYSLLSESVVSSAHMGMAYVNGVECHYLAFRAPHVDWQLWVKAEGDPLPMKYVITTKWMTGAPQYSVRFREWNIDPKIEAGQFDFVVPQGAKRVETINVDELGAILIGEGE